MVKLTVAPRLELIVSDEPFDRYNVGHGAAAQRYRGSVPGRTSSGLHGEGAKPTIAASYYRRLYDDGVPDVDFGSARNSVLLLASADVKGFHYDANALFNERPTARIASRPAKLFRFPIRWSGNFPVRRNLAFHAALPARPRRREFVGIKLCPRKIWSSMLALIAD